MAAKAVVPPPENEAETPKSALMVYVNALLTGVEFEWSGKSYRRLTIAANGKIIALNVTDSNSRQQTLEQAFEPFTLVTVK